MLKLNHWFALSDTHGRIILIYHCMLRMLHVNVPWASDDDALYAISYRSKCAVVTEYTVRKL